MRHKLATLTVAAAATLLLTGTASAQAASLDASLDLDAVHRAYFSIPASQPLQALHWFEEQANRYYHGDGLVSIATHRTYVGGQPATIVSGYVDRDGDAGYNPAADQLMFRFVQTAPLSGYRLAYQLLDGRGVVYYRGVRVLPRRPFYAAYYGGNGRFISYVTPAARIVRLRTWRVAYRRTPA